MALPLQVGDSSSQVSTYTGGYGTIRGGPYQIGGNYYTVIFEQGSAIGGGTSNVKVRVMYATDPTSSWTAQDTAHEPASTGGNTGKGATNDFGYTLGSTTDSSGNIHVAIAWNNLAVIQVVYAEFSTATNTWVTANQATVGTSLTAAGTVTSIKIVVRSTGDVVIGITGIYSGSNVPIYWARTAGSWGSATNITSTTGVTAACFGMALGKSDRVHFCYVGSGTLYTRSMSSANALDTEQSITATGNNAVIDATSYTDEAGNVWIVLLSSGTSGIWATAQSGADPTWTTGSATNITNLSSTYNYTLSTFQTSVYVVAWHAISSGDINYWYITGLGTTSLTVSSTKTGNWVSATGLNMPTCMCYTRSGTNVLAYVGAAGAANPATTPLYYDETNLTLLPYESILPAVTGTNAVGNTLTTTNGTWTNTPTSYTYQWTQAGVNIGGATSSTYSVASGDANYLIGCTVTATNANGSIYAYSNQLTIVPNNSVANTISGTAVPPTPLTSTTGTWTGNSPGYTSITYQWKRDTVAIPFSSTSSSYTTQPFDEGHTITCTVTATNAGGSTSVTSSNSITGTAPLFSTGSDNYLPGVGPQIPGFA